MRRSKHRDSSSPADLEWIALDHLSRIAIINNILMPLRLELRLSTHPEHARRPFSLENDGIGSLTKFLNICSYTPSYLVAAFGILYGIPLATISSH